MSADFRTVIRGSLIRVFEYGFDNAVLQKTYQGNIRTIKFPQVRVINLETDEKTPDKQTLRLIFPDKTCYDYEIDNFNLLKHDVSELEQRGFAILLPFYVLKMRGQVKKAKNSEGRKTFSAPLKKLVSDLMGAVDRCSAKGKIDNEDVPTLIKGMERLYKELFSQYKELAEGDVMLSEKLDYYTDKFVEQGEKKAILKVAKKMLALGDSVKKVSEVTGLPLQTIKTLQTKTKVA